MVRCHLPVIMGMSGSTGKIRHQVAIFWTKLRDEYLYYEIPVQDY